MSTAAPTISPRHQNTTTTSSDATDEITATGRHQPCWMKTPSPAAKKPIAARTKQRRAEPAKRPLPGSAQQPRCPRSATGPAQPPAGVDESMPEREQANIL